MFKIAHEGWKQEFAEAFKTDASALRILCPFIKSNAVEELLPLRRHPIKVITRFNLSDFEARVSDTAALRLLLKEGAKIRGIKNLHAKLYIFGSTRAIVTSANLTEAALNRNHEFGIISSDEPAIAQCSSYFESLWERAGDDLQIEQLDKWDKTVADFRRRGGSFVGHPNLGDCGADAGFEDLPHTPTPYSFHDAPQAFVKFAGTSTDRVLQTDSVFKTIKKSAFHRVACYPTTKRPTGVKDGAVMFMGRFTTGPDDIRVFGRGIGSKHVPGRDEATPEDINLRSWKSQWSNYVRLDHVEFVNGTLADGVSLYQLMDELGHDSFASTQRNARRGGNTDPHLAYRQQPAVKLSQEGFLWLSEKLDQILETRGRLPKSELATLDWPND